jgi:hypothetical protein
MSAPCRICGRCCLITTGFPDMCGSAWVGDASTTFTKATVCWKRLRAEVGIFTDQDLREVSSLTKRSNSSSNALIAF